MGKIRLTLSVAAIIAMVLIFHGTAVAVQLLQNEGAEDGVLAPWVSNPIGGSVVNDMSGAQNGDWYFSTATGVVTPGENLSISQDVDVTDCGVEGLPGLWEATGYSVSDSATDTGQLSVMFDDGSSAASCAPSSMVIGAERKDSTVNAGYRRVGMYS